MSVITSSDQLLSSRTNALNRRLLASAWVPTLIGLGIAVALTVFMVRSTAVSIVHVWYVSSTFVFGFLIVPLTGILIWRQRKELLLLQPRLSWLGIVVFLLSALLWFAGNIAEVEAVQHFALVCLIDSLIWAFAGTDVVRALRFPLLFLFFAVPVGESLITPLQQLTARATVALLRISGIPAVLDGFVLSVPSGDWTVAEACSGIRYLMSSLVIGVLFAGIAYRSWKRRVIFVALSVIIPVLANLVRAYGIVALGHLSNNRIAAGVDHLIYGWMFFALVTAVLITMGMKWAEDVSPAPPNVASETCAMSSRSSFVGLVCVVLIAVGSITLVTTAAQWLWSRSQAQISASAALIPPANWVQAADSDDSWAPQLSTITSSKVEVLRSARGVAWAYIGSYNAQRGKLELVTNATATGIPSGWLLQSSRTRRVVIDGEPATVSENVIQRGLERRLVWMWYGAGNKFISSSYRFKVLLGIDRLRGQPQPVALFALAVPVDSDPSAASQTLRSLLEQCEVKLERNFSTTQ